MLLSVSTAGKGVGDDKGTIQGKEDSSKEETERTKKIKEEDGENQFTRLKFEVFYLLEIRDIDHKWPYLHS
jgi:hypothetical protein